MPSIEEMLAAVEQNRLRCPVCGGGEQISFIYHDWYYRPASFPMDGSVLVDTDADSEDCQPPKDLGIKVPDLLACDNLKGHPDARVHWWIVPDGTVVRWT